MRGARQLAGPGLAPVLGAGASCGDDDGGPGARWCRQVADRDPSCNGVDGDLDCASRSTCNADERV